jgi:uncharacterized membrane protein HdeD (DUF308 family)
VSGSLLIIFAAFLLPFWGSIWTECPWKDLGLTIVSYMMAALILVYLFGYLIRKIKQHRGVVQVLTIIEFVLLFLIAAGLVLSQFNIALIPDSPSIILGVALYIRGAVEIIRAYYHQKSNEDKYSIGWVLLAILLVTGGVILVVTNLVDKMMVLYTIIFALAVLGIYAIIYGILAKPAKSKSVKKQ